jgi:citrate lyase subunit beta/citryl-CoA lyase
MKYRSVLFVPGHEEKKIRKAYTLNPDLIVIDLESTVPDQEKENAKKIIQTCDVNKKNTYIRINSNDDLSFVCDEKFIGIFLPFTESKEQLLSIDGLLKKNEKFKTDIVPIIESQKGLDNLQEICNFVERVKIISFGSHDLAKSINLKVSDNENEILEFRKLIAKFSKNPIDTSYLNFKDIDGFKRSCKIVKDLGFGGKACIHPNQIEISNEIFNEK